MVVLEVKSKQQHGDPTTQQHPCLINSEYTAEQQPGLASECDDMCMTGGAVVDGGCASSNGCTP